MKDCAFRWMLIGGLLVAGGIGIASSIGLVASVALALCGSGSITDIGVMLILLGVSVASLIALDRLEGHHEAR